jgi:hypothetical protein
MQEGIWPDDAELHAVDFKQLPRVAGGVVRVFTRRNLRLDLATERLAASVEDIRRDLPPVRRDMLDPDDGRDAKLTGPLRHGQQRPLFLRRVELGHRNVDAAQAGQVRFRKANDLRPAPGRLGDEPLNLVESILDTNRNTRRCQGDDHALWDMDCGDSFAASR